MGAASLPANWHGEILQDWWVVTLLDGMTGGFFVDLAAYDAVACSNSLRWRGIMPGVVYALALNHRPITGRGCLTASASLLLLSLAMR